MLYCGRNVTTNQCQSHVHYKLMFNQGVKIDIMKHFINEGLQNV